MATTKPINQPNFDLKVDVKCRLLAVSTTIPKGTLACLDGANGAKALTDTLMQAGATLLGYAQDTYENTTGAAVTKSMLFARACPIYLPKGKSGDAPTEAMIGKILAIQDNETMKATITGTDATVTLTEVIPGGGGFMGLLP